MSRSYNDDPGKELGTSIRTNALVSNSLLNILGQTIPIPVALFTVPFLISTLGVNRFAILTLAWTFLNFFNMFDLGLSRALTLAISQNLALGRRDAVPSLVRTALLIMFVFGILGFVIAALLSNWLATSAFKIPADLQTQSIYCFLLLAFYIPFAITASGFTGILAAFQRFDRINSIKIPTTMLMYVAPLIMAHFTKHLVPLASTLIASRLIAWVLYLVACTNLIPSFLKTISVSTQSAKYLLRYGSWITVSNVISPLMANFDQFIIASFISAASVAFYATPFDLASKLSILPVSISGALFPAFSAISMCNTKDSCLLFHRATKYLFVLMFPICLAMIAFSYELLTIWLGKDFAAHSTHVLQFLALGIFVNSLAYIPFCLIQSHGRPDITAKLHLAEFPGYACLMLWLILSFGINGSAIAWAIRATIDCTLLFYFARRTVLSPDSNSLRSFISLSVLSLIALLSPIAFKPLSARFALFASISVLFYLLTWYRLLSRDDKIFLKQYFIHLKCFAKQNVAQA